MIAVSGAFMLLAMPIMAIAQQTPDAQNISPTQEQAHNEITLVGDSNLMVPLTHIARHYVRNHHISVSLIAHKSGDLSARIRDGLPVDVVITGNTQTLAMLNNSGLIDLNSSAIFATDKAVLTRLKETVQTGDFDRRFIADYKIFLIDPQIDTGALFAAKTFHAHFADTEITPIILADFQALKQALKAPKHLAVLPQSMVSQQPDLMLVQAVNADEKSIQIAYRAEIIASEHMRDARDFVKFLGSPEIQSILHHYGFDTP
jgi:ABC-type molybdate transport system substrate-binding protein